MWSGVLCQAAAGCWALNDVAPWSAAGCVCMMPNALCHSQEMLSTQGA